MNRRNIAARLWKALLTGAIAVIPATGFSQLSYHYHERLSQDVGFGVEASTRQPWGRPVLGVTMAGDRYGPARVVHVAGGSAADEAGLRRGDVILSINGKRVDTYRDVLRIIKSYLPNDLLRIVIEHRGRTRPLTAMLRGAAPPSRRGERLGAATRLDEARH
jgi:predicted metalloprotease with PDZ domain